MTPQVKRNRTIVADLHYLTEHVLPALGARGRPARVEISNDAETGDVVAIVMGDQLRRPLAGRGRDARLAIRHLVDDVEKAIQERPQRRTGRASRPARHLMSSDNKEARP